MRCAFVMDNLFKFNSASPTSKDHKKLPQGCSLMANGKRGAADVTGDGCVRPRHLVVGEQRVIVILTRQTARNLQSSLSCPYAAIRLGLRNTYLMTRLEDITLDNRLPFQRKKDMKERKGKRIKEEEGGAFLLAIMPGRLTFLDSLNRCLKSHIDIRPGTLQNDAV